MYDATYRGSIVNYLLIHTARPSLRRRRRRAHQLVCVKYVFDNITPVTMSPRDPNPDFDAVIAEAQALQAQLPWLRLVCVGGTAAALHAGHRYSTDSDRVGVTRPRGGVPRN